MNERSFIVFTSSSNWIKINEFIRKCEVIGHYDPNNDDSHYKLIDDTDPSRGVAIEYRAGDRCPSGVFRTSTIDVLCANVPSLIVSALEPTICGYHMVMKSYHGCPTTCPITSSGLCNSHGHCAYDKSMKSAYCYCNLGWYGENCAETSPPSGSSYDGYSVQVGLLVVLLLVTLGLTGVVGLMVYRINEYRKEQQMADSMSMGQSVHSMLNSSTHDTLQRSTEMVEGSRF